jgi:hypothetical protein
MLFRRDQKICADVMICPICSTPTIHNQEYCIDAHLVSSKDLNGAKNKGSSNDFLGTNGFGYARNSIDVHGCS